MTRNPSSVIVCLTVILSTVSLCFAAPQGSSPATGTDSASLTIDGVIVSNKAVEIIPDTEQITSLTLERVLPHGTMVKKDQAIAWFDTEDIDRRIDKEQAELQLAELALEEAEFVWEQFQQQQRLDRQAADRAFKTARQEFDNYNKIDREEAIASAEYSLKNAQQSLENVQEELEQLQKMYDEDDLTEESEEIVLKRAKNAVEAAEHRLRLATTRHDRTIEQTIPQRTEAARDTFDRAELTHAKALQDLQTARKKKQIELRRQRVDLDIQKEKIQQLKQERKRLTLRSPIQGLLYHGALTRGRLSDKPSTLKAEDTVTAQQVLYTVVSLKGLSILAEVSEDQVPKLKQGLEGQATVSVLPEQSFRATVKEVDAVPVANKKFHCKLSLATPGGKQRSPERLVPGLSVNVTFGGDDEAAADGDQTDDIASEDDKAEDDKADEAAEKADQEEASDEG